MTKSFHISNLGSFGGNLTADMDGYVYTTISGVLSGRWDGKMTRDQAREIARDNKVELAEAEAELAEWQTR